MVSYKTCSCLILICFGYDINDAATDVDDAAILRQYQRCQYSLTISTMLLQMQTMLPCFKDIDNAAAAADSAAMLQRYRQCCCRCRRCCHSLKISTMLPSSTISTMLLQMLSQMLPQILPFFFLGSLSNDVIMGPLNHEVTSIHLKPCIAGGLGLLCIHAR